jgi:hypothetical protein
MTSLATSGSRRPIPACRTPPTRSARPRGLAPGGRLRPRSATPEASPLPGATSLGLRGAWQQGWDWRRRRDSRPPTPPEPWPRCRVHSGPPSGPGGADDNGLRVAFAAACRADLHFRDFYARHAGTVARLDRDRLQLGADGLRGRLMEAPYDAVPCCRRCGGTRRTRTTWRTSGSAKPTPDRRDDRPR